MKVEREVKSEDQDAPALLAAVAAAFAPDGSLAQSHPQYRPREGQWRMAQAVAETVTQGGLLVVEAGTGVGKTYAYLVPALLSGERVLISTATKALQDQLFARDLPQLARALGLSVRMALLKGRSNYLCRHRLEQAEQLLPAPDPQQLRILDKVRTWAQATVSGDLAELPGLDERSSLLPYITSSRENCLGTTCPRWSDCHVIRARREAMAADLVVVNHHLFFADLAVRESGISELLPSVRVVVFDEAHQLNDTGVQFLGRQCSTGQLRELGRDVLALGHALARGLGDWPGLSLRLDQVARDLRLTVVGDGKRMHWTELVPDGVSPQDWWQALRACAQALRQLREALASVAEMAPDLQRLLIRAESLYEGLAHFAAPRPDEMVRWLDAGLQLGLWESPVDMAQALALHLQQKASLSRQAEQAVATPMPGAALAEAESNGAAHAGPGKAWIFTSATLGEGDDLDWFVGRCGLQGARVLRVESPFDHAAQVGLHVPLDMPFPNDPSHSAAVAHRVAQAASRLGGRTLVLTTTLKAMRQIAASLQRESTAHGRLEILVQDQWPRRRMMERFREGSTHGQAGCVLVASSAFWEGFDVPGDALQLVVIDKLPFPPPGDPLVEARVQRIARAGGNPFAEYYLPETAMALKQGVGRLIRSETDQGLLLITDPRLRTMPYGARLLSTLPPMRWLDDAQAWDQALEALTRTSTKLSSLAGP